MRSVNKLILIATIFLIQCYGFSNENDQPPVSAVIEGSELIIKNNLSIDIYYFAVAQSALPYIFWVPMVDDFNRVPVGEFRAISTDSLFSYTKSEPVAFYYWDEDISEIISILIE